MKRRFFNFDGSVLSNELKITIFTITILNIVNCTQYALITFHGGDDVLDTNNILAYSLPKGKFEHSLINDSVTGHLKEMRGMVYDNVTQKLFFLNAHKTNSYLAVFVLHSCNETVTVTNFTDQNLYHPYGITMSPHGDALYVTNQDTQNIIRVAIDFASSSIFASLPIPRGLAFGADGYLYVASETSGILAYDTTTGKVVNTINAEKPIGVVAYKEYILFGCKSSDIKAYSTKTGKVEYSLTTPHDGIAHPAGLFVSGDTLYAVCQKKQLLLSFDLKKQKYIGKIVDPLPDKPESLIIMDC